MTAMWRKRWAMASLPCSARRIAHEDHPQRALYAALRMQEEMRRYSDNCARGRPPLADARGHQHRRSGGALDSQR